MSDTTKPNDGGLAFPQSVAFNPNNEAVTAGHYFPDCSGMTLRDHFAAAALTGFCSSDEPHLTFEGAAADAYRQADAMLAEREKRSNP
jgi:hypothetical protein